MARRPSFYGPRTSSHAAVIMEPGKLSRVVRVLCVDDNSDIADTLVVFLSIHGYDAVAKYDGESALAALDGGFRPDACCIDLNMPGMDGNELARRVRERLPDSPPLLIAVTAQDDADSARRALEAGFTSRLVKPADPSRLLAVLARLDHRMTGCPTPETSRPG